MKFIVEIPDRFQVTAKKIQQIINDGLEGAWHEPVKVVTVSKAFVGAFSSSHDRVSSMRIITRNVHQDKEGDYITIDGARIRLNDERLSGSLWDVPIFRKELASFNTHDERTDQDE